MSIVVQKYGGSSVADTQKLKRVAQRVMQTKASGHAVVVVVSAMGDTTDDLLKLAKTISANPDRRELDMLLSAGERISMALLSIAIRELGGDAISFTGSQSGIITNDRHVDARIIEVRPFRVQDELARGKILVTVQSHDSGNSSEPRPGWVTDDNGRIWCSREATPRDHHGGRTGRSDDGRL